MLLLLLNGMNLFGQGLESINLESIIRIQNQSLEQLNDSLVYNGWDYNKSDFGAEGYFSKSISWKLARNSSYKFQSPLIERGIREDGKHLSYYRTWNNQEYINIKQEVEDSLSDFKLIESWNNTKGRYTRYLSNDCVITFMVVMKSDSNYSNENSSQNFIIAVQSLVDMQVSSPSKK
jgi:hypothetical protein